MTALAVSTARTPLPAPRRALPGFEPHVVHGVVIASGPTTTTAAREREVDEPSKVGLGYG